MLLIIMTELVSYGDHENEDRYKDVLGFAENENKALKFVEQEHLKWLESVGEPNNVREEDFTYIFSEIDPLHPKKPFFTSENYMKEE